MTKKAEFPTSAYKVSCDYFDSALDAKFHKPKGETKLQIIMSDKDKEVRLSLYAEDVEALANFLLQAAEYTDPRKHE